MKDVIILGAGAAGYTAGIYAKRYGLDPLIIGAIPGGMATNAYKIENWPGVLSITGVELMDNFQKHASGLGVEIIGDKVTEVIGKTSGQQLGYVVKTAAGKEFLGKTLILALGTNRRKLGVPGEVEFSGKGVAYCATCDAPFFKGKTVAVVGGSNAATMAAMLLSQYCPQVYVIARGAKLKGEPVWIDRVFKNDKVKVVYNTNVAAIEGEKTVTAVKLDKPLAGKDKLAVDGVFVEIGAIPESALAEKLGVELSAAKRITVNSEQATNLSGVYAAGDITDKTGHFEQIVNSAYQGARAAYSVYQYLSDQKK
jgi:thioredoxin reductase (NADPH)